MELDWPQQSREFDSILLESVDETITSLFSREVASALYASLEARYSISKCDISSKPEAICSTLEKVFGSSSKTICNAIARRLYAKLALPFSDNPGGTLLEHVEKTKIMMRKR